MQGRVNVRTLGGRPRGWPIFVAGVIALAGCATPAQMDQMIPGESEAPAANSDSPFHAGIALGRVGGGEAPDLMYSVVGIKELEGTLRQTLSKFGYLSADDQKAPFRLQAFLVDMRRPGPGFTLVATSLIRYKLIRERDGSVVYDDVLKASATKTVSDAFIGPERYRMALEAAIRANIADFLAQLGSPNLEEKAR